MNENRFLYFSPIFIVRKYFHFLCFFFCSTIRSSIHRNSIEFIDSRGGQCNFDIVFCFKLKTSRELLNENDENNTNSSIFSTILTSIHRLTIELNPVSSSLSDDICFSSILFSLLFLLFLFVTQ